MHVLHELCISSSHYHHQFFIVSHAEHYLQLTAIMQSDIDLHIAQADSLYIAGGGERKWLIVMLKRAEKRQE